METPIELVRRFCAAWSDNLGAAELAAFFSADAVYHSIPLAPVTGREAIANAIASDKSFELPVMGTFEVSDGKINAWRD